MKQFVVVLMLLCALCVGCMKVPMEGVQSGSMYAGDCSSDENFPKYFECQAMTSGGSDTE
jgi:hypothetical protein